MCCSLSISVIFHKIPPHDGVLDLLSLIATATLFVSPVDMVELYFGGTESANGIVSDLKDWVGAGRHDRVDSSSLASFFGENGGPVGYSGVEVIQKESDLIISGDNSVRESIILSSSGTAACYY